MPVNAKELFEKRAYDQNFWAAYMSFTNEIDKRLEAKKHGVECLTIELTEKELGKIDPRIPLLISSDESIFTQLRNPGYLLGKIKQDYEKQGWAINELENESIPALVIGPNKENDDFLKSLIRFYEPI
jgi:hypothetical protein